MRGGPAAYVSDQQEDKDTRIMQPPTTPESIRRVYAATAGQAGAGAPGAHG